MCLDQNKHSTKRTTSVTAGQANRFLISRGTAGGSGDCLGSFSVSAPVWLKGQREAYSRASGTTKSSMEDRVRTYYRIIFPSEDPGAGSFLQPCDKNQALYRQHQTDGLAKWSWSAPLLHDISPSIKVTFPWLSLFHVNVKSCCVSQGSFISHPAPSFSFSWTVFSLKVHSWSLLNPIQPPPRAPTPVVVRDRCVKKRLSSCGTEVSDLRLWTSGGR